MALTSKQAKFVASYQLTLNPTEAAKNAGYSAKNAAPQGCRLMKDPEILAELDQWKQKKAKDISKDDYIDETWGVYNGSKGFVEEPSRIRALELAGKALGHIGNTEQRPNQTLNIQINATGNETHDELWALTRKLLGND